MKKTLLTLCALVCGTLAFAQTYTGNLHVWVDGDDDGSVESKITVAYDEEDKSKLDFTLHDFSITVSGLDLDLGDITVKEVDVVEGTNEATISCTDDHKVTIGSDLSSLVSDISVEMTGTISDDKLYANMTISVEVGLGSYSLGSYTITATFRSDSDDDLNGDYLIVDADGNYLGGGLTYGTQAAIIGKPQFIGFEVQSDGTYHLDSHQYNNATSHYLGSNLYFDSTPVDWTIAAVSGGYTIYGTVDDGTGYLTSNGFQTVPTVEATPYVWSLVTKDDVIASMDKATSYVPVDVTALIASPELKRNSNTTYYPTWTVTGYDGTGTPSNYAFGGGSAVANCAESYHSTNGFNINQELTLPLAGYYTLSAKGFYRDDNSTTLLLPVLYAGSQTSTFPEITRTDEYLGVADNMANAYQEFLLGLHSIDAITIQATSEGETITIGFKGEDTSLWNIFGELELLYYGEEAPVLPVHECVAEFDHWTISGNTGGSFQRNTWSTEADPSGMRTPFIEYWVGSGSQLSDATISHTQLPDLTAGYYEVSIFARAFNENSLVDVAEGITFTANNESIDLNKETHATYNHVSAEEYGTYKVYCQVTDDGKLDINFKLSKANCDWLAFKNLAVTYMGSALTDLPELVAATGTMNSTVASAQTAALAAYNAEEGATLDNYNVAYQAVECARASVAFYAGIAEALSELDDYLDDAGKKWLNANEAITAYNAQTLAYQDMYGVYMGAVKQQATIGIDLTEVMENTGAWTADQGNGPGSYSSGLATETYIESGEATEGEVLYYTVTGLSSDVYYTVSFYVAANMANGVSGDSGSGISQAYANDKTIDITVGTNSGAQITSLSDMTLVSINCTADEDGVLEFGIKNVADGGNWFLCAPASLAIAGSVEAVADDSDYEVGDEATVDSKIYSIVGENLFNNGGFNNGVLDWTAGSGYTNDLSILNVTYSTEGGYNNGAYITLKSSVGAANAATPTQAIAVEPGKTYLFVGYTSGTAPTDDNKRYSALFEMRDATTEKNHDESGTSYSNTIIELEWGDTGWTQTIGVFTVPAASEEGTYSYVGMRMNWSIGSYDGFQLYEVEPVADEVEWTLTTAQWGTLILPFDAELSTYDSNLLAYSCSSVGSDGTLDLGNSVTSISANTPYIIGVSEEITQDKTYTFEGTPVAATNGLTSGLLTGTFVDMDYNALVTAAGTNTVYLLQNHTGEGVAFYPVVTTGESSAATLTPYHCYLTTSSGSGVRAHIGFPDSGEETGIVAVESDLIAGDGIYDLSGRRVSKAVKGVYIQNGKKVLVK